MVFIQFSFIWSKFIVIYIITLVSSYFYFAAKEQFVMGFFKSLFSILRLFEANQCISVFGLANHFNTRDFPMFFIFMKKTVFQTCICNGSNNKVKNTIKSE